MSLSHFIAYKIVSKGKTEYDKSCPPDYAEARKRERDIPAPKGVKIDKISLDGTFCEYLHKQGNARNKIIAYIHGGGFVGGSSASRRDFTGYVANKLGYDVVSIDYCLAPEYPFPYGAEDCLKAYKSLVTMYGAKNICLVGESAGGNLVLSVALQAKSEGIELPACLVVFSPTVQYTTVFPSYKRNVSTDCMIGSTFLDEVRSTYLVDNEKQFNPYAAPLLGDFKGFPPTFIGVSDSEYLYDDSVELNEKLLLAGVKTVFNTYRKKMHAFQVIPAFPESKKALSQVKRFVDMIMLGKE